MKSPAKKAFAKSKKQSPKKLIADTHRALQDHYRRTYPDMKCESCGAPFQLMHHAVEKSQSRALWFDPDNLIFLCGKCHFNHHLRGDLTVMGNVILARGEEWYHLLKEKKRITKQWTRAELEQIKLKYS
jgi:5-methylcytosine-specific restriction endonuclease McrA